MAIPTIASVAPDRGPTGGGDIVRITGTGFADRIEVLFDTFGAVLVGVRDEGGASVADVRTPAHPDGVVDVALRNLDAGGTPVPGEEVVAVSAYRFLRPRVVRESDLTRLVRTLLRHLKREVLEATNLSVSVDYDDTTVDGLNVVALAKLPALVLSGPRVAQNRFYSTNEPHEDAVPGLSGPELVRRRPALTVDLVFTLMAASDRTVELLNLMAAVATFLNRHRWVEMPRDPGDPALGSVRWEMDLDGQFRTQLDGPNDVRAFSCGFVVRGFDIDEGLPLDVGKAVETTELGVWPLASPVPGGSP